MLITAIICFIDQRVASLLYNHFRDRLQIHKRFFSKLFCTTVIVIFQIIFDRDCSFRKSRLTEQSTELTHIESNLPPSFNLQSSQQSTPNRQTPNRPTPKADRTITTIAPTTTSRIIAPKPYPRTLSFAPSEHTIEIHQNDNDSEILQHYYTATESGCNA